MSELSLVMPMAGRGSRFSTQGISQPKPLVDLYGRPFFWWAVESVRKSAKIDEMVFVVLAEHCTQFAIDERIYEFYPDAQIIKIAEVTSGAAETAQIGLAAVRGNGPVLINDCDQAFICPDLAHISAQLANSAAGALLCFRSNNPAYSYIKLSDSGKVIGTVEKQVASPYAIAGCYLFSSAALFADIFQAYRDVCPYHELFISGLYDLLAARGDIILKLEAEQHLAFGTPEELAKIKHENIKDFLVWKAAA